MSETGIGGRLRAALSASIGPAGALGLVALLAAFVAVAGPRANVGLQDRALAQTLAATSPSVRAVSAGTTWVIDAQLSAAQLQFMTSYMGSSLRPPLTSPPSQQWAGLETAPRPVLDPAPSATLSGRPPKLELCYQSRLSSHARLVAGSFPGTVSSQLVNGQAATVLAVAASERTAARMSLRPGSLVDLGTVAGGKQLVLKVTGIVDPVGLSAAFWAHDSVLAAPALGGTMAPVWDTGMFIGPAELPALESAYELAPVQLTWEFPLRTAGLTAPEVPQALGALNSLETGSAGEDAMTNVGAPFTTAPVLGSGLNAVLTSYTSGQQGVGAVDDLLIAGLLAVALILVLTCSLVVADSYRVELGLLRARGGSRAQVAAWVGGRVLCIAGPALVIGVVAGVLAVPHGGNTLSWLLAGAAALTTLAGPLVATGWQHRAAGPAAASRRADALAGRRTARQNVAGLTLLAAATGGVITLRLQGVGQGSPAGLQVSLVPVLVAVAVGLVVAWVYPVPLRLLLGLAGRRSGTVGYLGLARAARSPTSVPLLPALALVVALAVVGLGAMVQVAIARGQAAASWQQVGADAMVQALGDQAAITPAAQRAVAAVPGVRRTATVSVTTAGSALAGNLLIGQLGEHSISVGVLIVSPRQYAAVVAGTPWPAFPAMSLERPGPGGAVPAIASPQVAADMRGGASQLAFGSGQLTLRLAGTTASTPALPAGGPFVLIPSWAAARLPGAPPAGTLLATGTGIDGRALSAAVARTQPGGQVLLRSAVLGSITGAPLRLGSVLIFELCTGAAVAFSVAALLLGLAHAGRDRARLSARLAALGTTRRQRSGIAMLEALPLVTIALAGGVAASLILVPLVGPGLDLASFTGSAATVPLRPEPAGLLGPAAGLLLLVCATALGTAAVARGSAAARSLRHDEGR